MKPLAGFILLLSLTMPANAQWHGHGGWHGYHGGYGNPLGGFFGGIIGGMIGGALTRPEPQVVVVPQSVPEIVPGSPSWYAYCAQKYRSWDGSSYLGYDGQRHPCQ